MITYTKLDSHKYVDTIYVDTRFLMYLKLAISNIATNKVYL